MMGYNLLDNGESLFLVSGIFFFKLMNFRIALSNFG